MMKVIGGYGYRKQLGHARHSNSYNLANKIFKNYTYIQVEGGNNFGDVLRNGKAGGPL